MRGCAETAVIQSDWPPPKKEPAPNIPVEGGLVQPVMQSHLLLVPSLYLLL